MKAILQQIQEGNEEVIIKYRQMTDRIRGIVRYVEDQGEKLIASKDDRQFLINIHEVIYLESVDGKTYLYTEEDLYKVNMSLAVFEALYVDEGFFRCSKSMVLNIYRIRALKSMSGSRIDVAMDNGEHIMISRRYAKELRSILKGEAIQ